MPATLTALAGLIASWRGRKIAAEKQKEMHQENTAAIIQNRQAVKNLDDHLNGNLSRIVAAAVAEALAKERLAVLTKGETKS